MSSIIQRNLVLYSFGPLYDLLQEYFPDHRSKHGVFDIPGLAKDMGLSHEAIYKAVRRSVLTVKIAERLLKFSHERHPEMPLYWDDLAEYVLPAFKKFSRAS